MGKGLKAFGGKSVEQVHASMAISPRAKCVGCGKRPYIRAIVMAPFDEAKKMMPDLDDLLQVNPTAVMQSIVQIRENPTDTVGKPYLRLSCTYACQSCRRDFEKALAKAPSWCIVEINYGPKDTIQTGYSRSN